MYSYKRFLALLISVVSEVRINKTCVEFKPSVTKELDTEILDSLRKHIKSELENGTLFRSAWKFEQSLCLHNFVVLRETAYISASLLGW